MIINYAVEYTHIEDLVLKCSKSAKTLYYVIIFVGAAIIVATISSFTKKQSLVKPRIYCISILQCVAIISAFLCVTLSLYSNEPLPYLKDVSESGKYLLTNAESYRGIQILTQRVRRYWKRNFQETGFAFFSMLCLSIAHFQMLL